MHFVQKLSGLSLLKPLCLVAPMDQGVRRHSILVSINLRYFKNNLQCKKCYVLIYDHELSTNLLKIFKKCQDNDRSIISKRRFSSLTVGRK